MSPLCRTHRQIHRYYCGALSILLIENDTKLMTSVLITSTDSSGAYVLHTVEQQGASGNAPSSSTRVVQVDPFTGELCFVGWFSDEESALLTLGRRGDVFINKRRVVAVLGIAIGLSVTLFVATKVREVALPVGSTPVFVVTQSDTITYPLLLPRDDPDGELERDESALKKLSVAEVSFYSHSLDLSRPFGLGQFALPANEEVASDFVWNHALRAPFVAIGCGECSEWLVVLLLFGN
jgi:hypothetical protein